MAKPFDQVELDAREITLEELKGFGVEWLRAVKAGDFVAANKIADSGLNAEHYLATLRLLRHLATELNAPQLAPTADQLETLAELRLEALKAREGSGYAL